MQKDEQALEKAKMLEQEIAQSSMELKDEIDETDSQKIKKQDDKIQAATKEQSSEIDKLWEQAQHLAQSKKNRSADSKVNPTKIAELKAVARQRIDLQEGLEKQIDINQEAINKMNEIGSAQPKKESK